MNPLGKEPSGKIASYLESIFMSYFILVFERTKVKSQGLPSSESTEGPGPTPVAIQCLEAPPQLPVRGKSLLFWEFISCYSLIWTLRPHENQVELAALSYR